MTAMEREREVELLGGDGRFYGLFEGPFLLPLWGKTCSQYVVYISRDWLKGGP